MFQRLIQSLPPSAGKWFAYALILLVPGSLIVLPVLWFARHFAPKEYGHLCETARHYGISWGH